MRNRPADAVMRFRVKPGRHLGERPLTGDRRQVEDFLNHPSHDAGGRSRCQLPHRRFVKDGNAFSFTSVYLSGPSLPARVVVLSRGRLENARFPVTDLRGGRFRR